MSTRVVQAVRTATFVLLIAAGAAQAAGPEPSVVGLTTEHMTNPIGLDQKEPRLGWIVRSTGRGVTQSA